MLLKTMLNNSTVLYISFLNNNIHAKLKVQQKMIISCSSGQFKFKGSTKKGLIAAETIAGFISNKIMQLKIKINCLTIVFKGTSLFKKGLLKKLCSFKLPVHSIIIKQVFTITHNGCSLQKKKRK